MLVIACTSMAANAATYTVNVFTDVNTGSGTSGTLRWCIAQANANTGPHVINVGTANQTITVTSSQSGVNGVYSAAHAYIITQPVTINGNGLIINGNDAHGIFHINASGSVTIQDLHIKNGRTAYGGALIVNNGNSVLAINHCLFEFCYALENANNEYGGGAIYVYNSKSTTISYCGFSGCSANSDYGHSIYRYSGNGTVNVNNSTFPLGSQYAHQGNITTSNVHFCSSAAPTIYKIGEGTTANPLTRILAHIDGTVLRIIGKGVMKDMGSWGSTGGAVGQYCPWSTAGVANTTITSATVGEGVTALGRSAFLSHTALQSITLPSTLTAINGAHPLVNTPNLRIINISAATPPAVAAGLSMGSTGTTFGDATAFNAWASQISLNFSGGAVSNACAYATHAQWGMMEHGGVAPGNKYFGKCVRTNRAGYPTSSSNDIRFYIDCNNKLNIYTTTTNAVVMDDMYDGNYRHPWYNLSDNMLSAEVTGSITTIGAKAFTNCRNMTTVKFPASVTTIGLSAFQNCSALSTIDMRGVQQPPAISTYDGAGYYSVPYMCVGTNKRDPPNGCPNVLLLINNEHLCNWDSALEKTCTASTCRTCTDCWKHAWKEFKIPQLEFTFDDNKED